MITLEEEVCCAKTKVVIGRNSVNVLEDEVNGKTLVVRQKATSVGRIVKAINGNVFEVILDGGEYDKNMETVFKIIEILYAEEFQRKDRLIAVGGGTLTDVAGFVASIYMRGLRLVFIPTTVLGMVDAALGGKNAVNFKGIKNVLGTFYQPSTVIIDLNCLDTLPQQELLNGIAEAIKHGVVLDRDLFSYLKNNIDRVLDRDDEALEYIIYRSVVNKMSIVKEDPYELRDTRTVLNFGHTVGHAIEVASGFKIPHGRAVAVGMVLETAIGVEIGVTSNQCLEHIIDVIKLYGLPASLEELDAEIDKDALLSSLPRDKKVKGSKISMPFPVDIGVWRKHYMHIDVLREAVAKWIG